MMWPDLRLSSRWRTRMPPLTSVLGALAVILVLIGTVVVIIEASTLFYRAHEYATMEGRVVKHK